MADKEDRQQKHEKQVTVKQVTVEDTDAITNKIWGQPKPQTHTVHVC